MTWPKNLFVQSFFSMTATTDGSERLRVLVGNSSNNQNQLRYNYQCAGQLGDLNNDEDEIITNFGATDSKHFKKAFAADLNLNSTPPYT